MSKGKAIKTKVSKTKVILWIVFALFSVYALTLVFPFFWVASGSFKNNWDLLTDIWGLPKSLFWANYSYIFREYNFLSMFGNSLVLTLGGAVLNVIMSSLAAYTVAKYKFRFRNAIYVVALVVMLIPTTGSIASMYEFMADTNLMETYVGILLIYSGAFGMNFLLLYSYFKGISWTYAEAAFVDGASSFRVFTTIMIPLAKGGLAAVFMIQAIGFWNDFYNPFLFLSTKPTIAVGLQDLSMQASSQGMYTELFAGIIVATIPIIVVFSIFEKQIIANTIAGGIKG